MAAVMEINILSEKFIEVKELFDILNGKFNLEMKVNNAEVMDNWEYENIIKLSNQDNISEYIKNNKIVNFELSIYNKCSAGCQVEKIDDVYLMCLWIDTLHLEYLDSHMINEENEKIYESITNEVIKSIDKYKIIITSIGIETMFVYDKDVNKIINKSASVIKWIVPNMYEQNINKYYLEEKYEPYVGVYTRTID
ncbi:hypothetical protein [Clostridium sp. ZBS13]|uniref:hypothetical protein n=1 Tax=Clostridium sp. ZBS13 TaxID=2949971 RepID=UPI002079303E|nr:hypothetical protein [Clostridium sp. ZBS13]